MHSPAYDGHVPRVCAGFTEMKRQGGSLRKCIQGVMEKGTNYIQFPSRATGMEKTVRAVRSRQTIFLNANSQYG